MIEQHIRLYCDSCDKPAPFMSNHSIAQARHAAKENGWKRHATDGGTLDICSSCAAFITGVRS